MIGQLDAIEARVAALAAARRELNRTTDLNAESAGKLLAYMDQVTALRGAIEQLVEEDMASTRLRWSVFR